MTQRQILESIKRMDERNLIFGLMLNQNYSDSEDLQTAFNDGYVIGLLSNCMSVAAEKSSNPRAELLAKAISGDKDAIKELENTQAK